MPALESNMEGLKKNPSRSVSRKSSRQRVVQVDSTSLTSFPDPPASPREDQSTRSLLNGLLDRPSDDDLFAEQTDPLQPQALAAASSKNLNAIINGNGSESIVRRLALALAERDAHITALRRLAEEYHVPHDKINLTLRTVSEKEAGRVAEERKQDLANAASERFTKSFLEQGSNTDPAINQSCEVKSQSRSFASGNGTMKGITRLFAGYNETLPRRKRSKGVIVTPSPGVIPASSKGFSMPDTGAVTRAAAATANFFLDRPASESKAPVKLTDRLDPNGLPPTLSTTPADMDDPQYIAWNRYLVRLAEIREKSGELSENGELVGASRFGTEGADGRKKMARLMQLVLIGIPMQLRGVLWMELSGTQSLIEPDGYKQYLSTAPTDLMRTDLESIMKDIPRTLTESYDFYTKEKGADKLKNVLTAFVAKYEGYGYTQGLNMIAGYLLLVIPIEEEAFWMLCNMVDNFFPEDYFARTTAMRGPLADCIVVREFLRRLIPKTNRHLDKLGVDAAHTGRIGWMLTAFASTLPPIVLFRVWDVLLCLPKGNNFIIQAAVAMFSLHQQELQECEDAEDVSVLQTKMTIKPEDVDKFVNCAQLCGAMVNEHITEQRKIALRAIKRTPSLEMLTGYQTPE